MATSVVLKKVPQQAVVKILGPGTVTIDLADLATATQNFDRANAAVNINSLMFTSTGTVVIQRNNANVYKMTDGQDNHQFSQFVGCSLAEGNGSNVVVTFLGSADGSIIMGLSKVAGYPANVQTYDGVQNFVSGN